MTLQSGIPLQSQGVRGPLLDNPYPQGPLPPGGPNWAREGDQPPPREWSYPAVYTMKCRDQSAKKMQVKIKLTQAEGKFDGKKAELLGIYLHLQIKGKGKITLNESAEATIDCEFVDLPEKMCYAPAPAFAGT